MQIQSDKTVSKIAVLQDPEYWLSDSQIAKRYGVARQTVWRWAATDPNFPKPIKLSPGCTRWRISLIEAWENGKEVA